MGVMTVALTPTPLTDRSVAPDLARGAMLLLIAIANAPWYLWAAEKRDLSSHPVDASALDRVVQTISLIAIDGRTYPMFAFLFGYGIWQLYSRQLAAGIDRKQARRLLRRRHWWMLAFGFVHAALLWMGDIVGAYGLAGLVLTWLFIDRRDVTIRIWAASLAALLALSSIAAIALVGLAEAMGVAPGGPEDIGMDLDASMREESFAASIGLRLAAWAFVTPVQALVGLAVPIAVLLAILAARRRLLEEPLNHERLLRNTAIVGIAIGWGVGAVVALQNLNVLGLPESADLAISSVSTIAGLACGVGYVALFGFIAARMSRRGSTGRISFALRAVGKRSLTFYLAQSVVFAPLMAAWGLGLGAELSSWSIALVAIATWLATVVIAVQLEKRGIRGPAEWALRRLAYPSSGPR